MSRIMVAGLTLLLTASCSAFDGTHFQRLELVTSVWVATAETTFGPRLDVYDRGLLVFADQADEWAAVVNPEALDVLRQSLRQPSWWNLLAEFEGREHSSVSDRPGLLIHYNGRRGAVQAFVPLADLPDSLRPQLREIDQLFARHFAAHYPLRLAELHAERGQPLP